MCDVFISYSQDNMRITAEFVRKIVEDFESKGIACWYAGRDMGKAELPGIITHAIRECRVFILVLDKNACKSVYLKSEIALAYRRLLNYETMSMFTFWIDAEDDADDNDNAKHEEINHLLKSFQLANISPSDMVHVLKVESAVCNILGCI